MNNDSDYVGVLLGNGDGTFQPALFTNAGNILFTVLAVDDLNRDGKADVVVADFDGGYHLSVLPGKGDGTFGTPIKINFATDPYNVTTGDFNRDGIQDLAVAKVFDDTVSVLLGNGNGSFHGVGDFAVGNDPEAVATGDFNHDGKQDLAVANAFANSMSVLLGKADGTFQPAVTYGAGSLPAALVVGDFNRDGNQDLAIANFDGNNVTLPPGRGDGTFPKVPAILPMR